MAAMNMNQEQFKQLIREEKPVLVDFWAPWCGPCRMMSSVVAELADEYQGKAIIGKVNVDEEPELAASFSVASIPMFVVMKGGKIANTKIGAMPKANLEAMLK